MGDTCRATRADQAGSAQYPAFYLRHSAFGGRQIRLQEPSKGAIAVGMGQPGGNGVGIVLVACVVLDSKATAPQRRIDLGDDRATRLYLPAVERPEMDAGAEPLSNEAQPGYAGMSGLRHRTLNIEVKY